MHDDLIERRLSAALRDEAAALTFTITADELERRLTLRRRSFAGRRLTLLVAAAVGISLFGIAGALSGLFNRSLPIPSQAVVATTAPRSTTAAGVLLPSLDSLLVPDLESVAFAQAHGPDRGAAATAAGATGGLGASVSPILGAGHIVVTFACLGEGSATVALDYQDVLVGMDHDDFTGEPPSPFTSTCDGTTREHTFAAEHPGRLAIATAAPASWRVVARFGSDRGTIPPPQSPALSLTAGDQELVRVEGGAIGADAQPWGATGLLLQEIGAVSPREAYGTKVWCARPGSIRVIFGDSIDGAVVPDTETVIGCDSENRELRFATPLANGSKVYVAAPPNLQWSALVTGPNPPIALTRSLPGWTISGGLGPEFAVDTRTMSFGGAGVGEDHVQVVLACTGPEPIDVIVEDGQQIGSHTQRFQAACAPDGVTSSQTFTVTEQGVAVRYVAPKGTWTALSILVPSN